MGSMRSLPGTPLPLGATPTSEGINFALFSKHATAVTLCLFASDKSLLFEIPVSQRTGDIWHVLVEGVHPPLYYAYKIEGPAEFPFAFDKDLLLLDPYAIEVTSLSKKRISLLGQSPSLPLSIENIPSPQHKENDLLVYEMHVGGFTKHPSSGVQHPGSFLGMMRKSLT